MFIELFSQNNLNSPLESLPDAFSTTEGYLVRIDYVLPPQENSDTAYPGSLTCYFKISPLKPALAAKTNGHIGHVNIQMHELALINNEIQGSMPQEPFKVDISLKSTMTQLLPICRVMFADALFRRVKQYYTTDADGRVDVPHDILYDIPEMNEIVRYSIENPDYLTEIEEWQNAIIVEDIENADDAKGPVNYDNEPMD